MSDYKPSIQCTQLWTAQHQLLLDMIGYYVATKSRQGSLGLVAELPLWTIQELGAPSPPQLLVQSPHRLFQNVSLKKHNSLHLRIKSHG
jgi:hypothetical protein